MKRFLSSLIGLAVAAGLSASVALAAGGSSGSVLDAYGGPGAAQAKLSSPPPLAAAKPTSGTLPFTGLDLGLALAFALGLLALGLVLRRAGRRSSN